MNLKLYQILNFPIHKKGKNLLLNPPKPVKLQSRKFSYPMYLSVSYFASHSLSLCVCMWRFAKKFLPKCHDIVGVESQPQSPKRKAITVRSRPWILKCLIKYFDRI